MSNNKKRLTGGSNKRRRFKQRLRLKRKPKPDIIQIRSELARSPLATVGYQINGASSFQSRYNVRAPNDNFEQEANRVARSVMNMPSINLTGLQPVTNQVTRSGGKVDSRSTHAVDVKQADSLRNTITPVQARTIQLLGYGRNESSRAGKNVDPSVLEEEQGGKGNRISRQETDKSGVSEQTTLAVTPTIERRIDNLNGRGQILPKSERTFFERRMGVDFRGVRVHTDQEAANTSQRLQAQAFTVGNHIVFNKGKYRPGTTEGRHLLAHELTHVIQQKAVDVNNASTVSRKDKGKGATPSLSYSTVNGPTGSNCGGYNWVVQWKLDKVSTKGGWVIQHLQATPDVKKKYSAGVLSIEVPHITHWSKWPQYWEAWPVNKGQKVTTYAEGGDLKDDTYWYKGAGERTRGSIKMDGNAKFYEGLKLPKGFKVDRKTPAGILPMTVSDPGLSGGSAVLKHNLKATWNCQGKDKKTKVETV